MKPTIRQISPAKFWRLRESKGSHAVLAKVFDEATWGATDAYSAFANSEYIYVMMRTKEPDMHACYKRFPVGWHTKKQCLLVSRVHPWV